MSENFYLRRTVELLSRAYLLPACLKTLIVPLKKVAGGLD